MGAGRPSPAAEFPETAKENIRRRGIKPLGSSSSSSATPRHAEKPRTDRSGACFWPPFEPAANLPSLGAALAGCQDEPQPGDGRRRRIALIYKATTNPFFRTMEKGAREKAAELGVALEVAGIPSEAEPRHDGGPWALSVR